MKILFQNHTISNICKKNIDKTLVKFPHFSYLCKEFILCFDKRTNKS